MPPALATFNAWNPGSHFGEHVACWKPACFPPLTNSLHSHKHQPFALLCQAQEGEDTNQKQQEQQEDIGQPPAGRRTKKTASLRRLSAPPSHPNPIWSCDLPAAR
uniref:Uncharacterized protein n=1 Tax=Mus spicilegus TaxID=10103 RepID=A0A8C6IIL3_MUSSI